ncbi:Protein NRDE2 like protein [Daldinia childiae]|uniref:Protein NRDE2 like protein n=1 Tax=Daldinia childiae TaxID=326645 RepID=UPI0014473FF7|nr:Protein NRDE2 like protein [Daldinia childiae]KAF3059377.1 Protein NRDE2 like protein [Daldinia childiae]
MSSKQEKPSTVPKFSSFKPHLEKPQPQNEAKPEELKQRGTLSISRRERHDSPGVISHHTEKASHNKPPQRPSSPEQDRDSFFVYDKRGDSLIRRYSGNDRRDIPNYRRFGFGRILGANGYMKIDHTGSRDEFFLLGFRESGSLLGSDRKSLLAKGGHFKSQPIRVRREQSQTVAGSEDFVPLKTSRKRKRDRSEPADSSSDEGQAYRSIHGKSKSHEHSDSDMDYGSETSTGSRDRGADEPTNLKTIELSRKVRDHPQDIDAWLELVNHQDTLLRISGQDSHHSTGAEIKSFASIKLSLLEQAYFHAATDSQRERLQLRIMQEGSKIWDSITISKEWELALGKHGVSFELWREYTNFQQTKLSTFQYDKIQRHYANRMNRLAREALMEQDRSNEFRMYEQMIYVFLRATRFIVDSGYKELGIAAWQAALELTFARPPTLSEKISIAPPFGFKDFWESEVPRIGEDGASGWATFEEGEQTLELPEAKALDEFISPSTRDGYKAWSILEQHQARVAANPVRTMDVGPEDDPFRVVMYADIQDILLHLPNEAIPGLQCQLLDAFLIFCQLPPAFSSSEIVQDMLQDSFLARSPADPITIESSPSLIINTEGQNKRPPEFSHDYERMEITPEVLFPVPNWFKNMKKIRGDVPADQYTWISTTLKQLVRKFGIGELGPYYLAFESINEPGHEKKTAKALLKEDSTNVDLYLGYCILEWTKGNKDIARITIPAAMGLPAISVYSKFSLNIAAAWMELEDGNLTKATLQLCILSDDPPSTRSISESPPASTAQILKTRHSLSSKRDYLLSLGDAESAIIYAEGLALLEYLTGQSNKEASSGSQGDIWSAISSISTCSDELVSRDLRSSSAHEILLQFAARLLYYHASQGPFRPGFLREQLTKYINFFPQNTIFLNLYAWREARLSIDDRVRSILDKVVLVKPHDCISSRVFAIRYESRTGNIHSTRAAFEHAFESEACRNHPGLWVSYIRFCHGRKELRAKAKSVFYRALQCCPWSKEVFMEAFVTLVRDMDSSELRSVYNTMCEKRLRVHVEMEEFVEGWRREHKGKDRATR